MKHSIICLALVGACGFSPDGADVSDAGTTDAVVLPRDAAIDASLDAHLVDAQFDASVDASAPPTAFIVCSNELVDGIPKVVLTLSGDIQSGLLDDPTGANPLGVYYGSNQEDLTFTNSCQGTWEVPYSSGCRKSSAAWGPSPKLYLEPEVDYLNVAVLYADGSKRWGDLKTADGDPVGFVVSGLDCRIELTEGGTGGYIRTHPNP